MSPGVPYVSVRSNDVLNGSLDLVLRLCTRVDTVWRVLRPGREVGIFLLDPSPHVTLLGSKHVTHLRDTSTISNQILRIPEVQPNGPKSGIILNGDTKWGRLATATNHAPRSRVFDSSED